MELRLRPLRPLEEDLEEVSREPLPTWLVRYYEVHSFAFPDRPTPDRMPVSVRVAAIKLLVHQRLTLLADVLRRLEALGWSTRIEAGRVVVAVDGDEHDGWARLRRAGVGDQLILLMDAADVARVPGPAALPAAPARWPEGAPDVG
ncbi:MAG TPA: hypothetical protein VNN74_07155 [Candidatus Micrarchaeia archaeon]|nr:hypothetical protein [Candidatus Micrarchaeia archaeon]